MGDIISIFLEYGTGTAVVAVLVATVVSFVYRDWRKIESLEKRIEGLETEFRTTTLEMLGRCEQSLKASTDATVQSSKILQQIIAKVVK